MFNNLLRSGTLNCPVNKIPANFKKGLSYWSFCCPYCSGVVRSRAWRTGMRWERYCNRCMVSWLGEDMVVNGNVMDDGVLVVVGEVGI